MLGVIVRTLLVALLILRGIGPLPHAHSQADVTEPAGHAQRPHIHLSQHGHRHDHHHRNSSAHGERDHACGHHHASRQSEPTHVPLPCDSDPNTPSNNHDDDAVYLTDGSLVLPATCNLSYSVEGIAGILPIQRFLVLPNPWRQAAAPPRYGGHVSNFVMTSKLLI